MPTPTAPPEELLYPHPSMKEDKLLTPPPEKPSFIYPHPNLVDENSPTPSAPPEEKFSDSLPKDEKMCKFCLETMSESDAQDKLISPCKCNGSVKWVHRSCLHKWFDNAPEEQKSRCRMCSYEYRKVWSIKPIHRWTAPSLTDIWRIVKLSDFLLRTADLIPTIKEKIARKSVTLSHVFHAVELWIFAQGPPPSIRETVMVSSVFEHDIEDLGEKGERRDE